MGARRWISLPGIGSMQPSEFMKVCHALMMASYCRPRIPAEVYAYCDFVGYRGRVPFLLAAPARLNLRSLDSWCVRHFPQRYLLAAHYFGLWRIGCCGSLTLDVLFARVPKKASAHFI